MPLVFIAALLVLLIMSFWIVGHLIGFVIMLAIAALVGYGANAVVPGRVPYGFPGLALVGLLGGWLGTALFGHLGPNLFGLWIVPAFIGAVILTLVLGLFAGQRRAF